MGHTAFICLSILRGFQGPFWPPKGVFSAKSGPSSAGYLPDLAPLLLLRNTMQTARQVLRRQLQHPRSILLRARPHEDQPSSQTQPDPLHRPPGKAPPQHNPEVLLRTFPPARQRLHRLAVTKFSTPAAAAFPAFRHGKSTEHRENGEPYVFLKLIENTSQY